MKKILLLIFVSFALGWGFVLIHDISLELTKIDKSKLHNYELRKQEVIFYDSKGLPLYEWHEQRNSYVELKQIPKILQQAFIAAEDERFYEHRGVDFFAIARSIWVNLRKQDKAQGASTITQQLARSLFLSRKKNFNRKLKEVFLALALERFYSKHQILELYLNHIFLGLQKVGIASAADYYFAKSVDELTLAQASLLAGLARSPAYDSPFFSPSRAKTRRSWVLSRMRDGGFITTKQMESAQKEKLPQKKNIKAMEKYSEYAITLAKNEFFKRFAYLYKAEAKLHVYTTIDYRVQRVIGKIMQAHVNHLNNSGSFVEGSAVIIHPLTGALLAVQGGSDFKITEFNRAIYTKRPLGSAFLPFYIGLALQNGYQLNDSIYKDINEQNIASKDLPSPSLYDLLLSFLPEGGSYLYASLGEKNVYKFIRQLGLNFGITDLRLALGRGQASVFELAGAYSSLFFSLKPTHPYIISKITSADGSTIWQHLGEEAGEPLVSEAVSYILRYASAHFFHNSLDKTVANLAKSYPFAGKLGNDGLGKNLYLIAGYSDILLALWVGLENGQGKISDNKKSSQFVLEEILTDFWQLAQLNKHAYLNIPKNIAFGRIKAGKSEKASTVPIKVRF